MNGWSKNYVNCEGNVHYKSCIIMMTFETQTKGHNNWQYKNKTGISKNQFYDTKLSKGTLQTQSLANCIIN